MTGRRVRPGEPLRVDASPEKPVTIQAVGGDLNLWVDGVPNGLGHSEPLFAGRVHRLTRSATITDPQHRLDLDVRVKVSR